MATPKPSAPSKPLSFRPPEIPEAKKKHNRPGLRPNVVAFDEVVHVEPLDGGMVMSMPINAVEDIAQHASEEDRLKSIFDFSTSVEKKPVSETKKPFVLDPHLTQRPFHDERLMQLKETLQRPSSKNR